VKIGFHELEHQVDVMVVLSLQHVDEPVTTDSGHIGRQLIGTIASYRTDVTSRATAEMRWNDEPPRRGNKRVSRESAADGPKEVA
jgi:hypothetical protein